MKDEKSKKALIWLHSGYILDKDGKFCMIFKQKEEKEEKSNKKGVK